MTNCKGTRRSKLMNRLHSFSQYVSETPTRAAPTYCMPHALSSNLPLIIRDLSLHALHNIPRRVSTAVLAFLRCRHPGSDRYFDEDFEV